MNCPHHSSTVVTRQDWISRVCQSQELPYYHDPMPPDLLWIARGLESIVMLLNRSQRLRGIWHYFREARPPIYMPEALDTDPTAPFPLERIHLSQNVQDIVYSWSPDNKPQHEQHTHLLLNIVNTSLIVLWSMSLQRTMTMFGMNINLHSPLVNVLGLMQGWTSLSAWGIREMMRNCFINKFRLSLLFLLQDLIQ